jgi:hypothetical protein
MQLIPVMDCCGRTGRVLAQAGGQIVQKTPPENFLWTV